MGDTSAWVSAPERLLYIAGAARSGSTVLSLLLGQHPQMIAGSQLEWLSTYASLGAREPCTCGRPVGDCPFWREVAEQFATLTCQPRDYAFRTLRRRTVYPLRTAPAHWLTAHAVCGLGWEPLLRRGADHSPVLQELWRGSQANHRLFRAMRRAAGKPVVVDSSKVGLRGKALYMAAPASVRLVWLVRDGRGVVWSRMRRHGESVERATAVWLRSNLEVAACLATIPKPHRMLVRYEDLCDAPPRELDRICRLVGVPPAAFSTELGKRSSHLLGGNEMRYRPNEQSVLEVDSSWRDNLAPSQLTAFDKFGGWLNRRFGYE